MFVLVSAELFRYFIVDHHELLILNSIEIVLPTLDFGDSASQVTKSLHNFRGIKYHII